MNDENFGDLLIGSLEQIAAYRRGELPDSRVVKRITPPWRVESPGDDDLDDDPDAQEYDPRNRLRR